MPESDASDERSARERLDAHRDLLGKVSDGEIAALAGVSRGVVGAWRRQLQVPAYDGYLWTAGRKSRAERRGAGEAVPAPAPAPEVERRARRSDTPRGSRLDAWRDLVGRLSDGEVARRVGMTREAVRIYRKKHGIPAFAAAEPAAPASAAPASAAPASAAPASAARSARPGPAAVSWGWKVRVSTGEERLVVATDAVAALGAAAALGEVVAVERVLPLA